MHFRRGREEADDDSFNDVVYRTNQAFEGILKEAYVVLTGKDASKLRPVDLESHYSTNNVLSAYPNNPAVRKAIKAHAKGRKAR
jgi:hypothetical protein